jgi:hypothetical protein
LSLDVSLAVRPTLRPAVEASVPGKVVPVFFEQVASAQAPPYVLVRVGAGAPQTYTMHEYLATVYLDIWAQGTGQQARIEDAVAYLDDYDPPDYGQVVGVRYRLESVTRLAESETLLHTTNLYSVRYFDRRRLATR